MDDVAVGPEDVVGASAAQQQREGEEEDEDDESEEREKLASPSSGRLGDCAHWGERERGKKGLGDWGQSLNRSGQLDNGEDQGPIH